MLEGSAAIFGVMFVGWLEFGLYFARQSSASFRFPIAFQAFFPIIVMIMVPMLEESPRWLAGKDRFEEARLVLSKLEDEPEDSVFVAEQLLSIRQSLEVESQGHSSNAFARTKNRHLNRTLIAIGVNVLAQLSGVNVITFYSNTILQQRLGRKLLISGAFFMCVANAGLAGLQSDPTNRTAAGCSLLFYFLALAAFPIGMFLIPLMYSSEIAPLRIRAKVTAMSGCSNWLFNFMVAEVTPIAFDSIQWKYYLVYVCTNLLSVVVFYLFLPGTRNRSLEDIDAFFVRSTNPLQPVKVAKMLPEDVPLYLESTGKSAVQAEQVEKI
ncbi:hypothetical protein CBER1_07569 [Cercospora berteroae]|uniref:Major facilitator superfamily (MFS) profile domain-containing protein n=1 Tax=Cercospora berteroae TaxID=357750 RepID=A0A2S6CK26_9PEZI|nr:hypothetical protein CBER1_07569 [Cercospora berteroae]